MSTFFFEDLVAFKTDASIIGTIEITWSDVDQGSPDEFDTCYIHDSLPSKVRKAWFDNQKLLPGYVVVNFNERYNACCLISESSLTLVDRAMAVGDMVKRSAAHAESGTVISTSVSCTLQPCCSEPMYNNNQPIQAQAHIPSHGSYASKRKLVRGRFRDDFPTEVQATHTLGNANPSSPLRTSAQDLTHYTTYREEDFVIYQDWVGQLEEVHHEVSVRLLNGSVVTVQDPEELLEPFWVPGTRPCMLMQRLDHAGFYKRPLRLQATDARDPLLIPAKPCYPGQFVETKKGNLRRGRWKFGAYDPSVPPQGIVVDVQCIELEVRWVYPNLSLALRNQAFPPPDTLGLDELETGRVKMFDRSRQPKSSKYPDASYAPDTTYGQRVRCKDAAGAAVKYSHFRRLTRAATQGFDMNVLLVTSTSTKVVVRWQDWSVTEEDSTALFPYLNVDEHDVWPGDRVSLVTQEQKLDIGNPGSIRLNKVGVVQSVVAAARMARVRWFLHPSIEMDDEREWQSHGSTYGKLSDETVEVPLYDIAAHPALATNLGDLAIILPEPTSSSVISAVGSSIMRFLHPSGTTNLPDPESSSIGDSNLAPNWSSQPQDSPGISIEWFGEIVDICPDGDVIVRLGAAFEAQDVKVPAERIFVVASEMDDSDSGSNSDEEEEWSVRMSVSSGEDDAHTDNDSAVSLSYEYEGGQILNSDEDEEEWWTDEEEESQDTADTADIEDTEDTAGTAVPVQDLVGAIDPAMSNPPSTSSQSLFTTEQSMLYTGHASVLSPFSILESPPPADHRFFNTHRPLTAEVMRRITKETKIMQDSLPEGIFVRTWDTRLDLLRVLIVGPCNTPYEYAPFVIDIHYGAAFPVSPPEVFFHSWTNNMGRVNPNLYEDGKICLSLLGTWDGDTKNEEWSSKSSTILQLLVSIMGLVLVRHPYFNEAGFDVLIGSEDSKIPSALYNEKAYIMSRAFVKTALSTPPQGLEDIILWLYVSDSEGPHMIDRIIKDIKILLAGHNEISTKGERSEREIGALSSLKLSAGAMVLLERTLQSLEHHLNHHEKPGADMVSTDRQHESRRSNKL